MNPTPSRIFCEAARGNVTLPYVPTESPTNVGDLNRQRCNNELENLVEQYIASLTEKELKAYEIAREHLGTSFQIEKSNGFIQWCKKQAPPPK
jgi:hypothetical protein